MIVDFQKFVDQSDEKIVNSQNQFQIFSMHQQNSERCDESTCNNCEQLRNKEDNNENLNNFIENWQPEQKLQPEQQQNKDTDFSMFNEKLFQGKSRQQYQDLAKIYFKNRVKQKQFQQIGRFNSKLSQSQLSPQKHLINKSSPNPQYLQNRTLLNDQQVTMKKLHTKQLIAYTALQIIFITAIILHELVTGYQITFVVLLLIRTLLCCLHVYQMPVKRIHIFVTHVFIIILGDIFASMLLIQNENKSHWGVSLFLLLIVSDLFISRRLVYLINIQKQLDKIEVNKNQGEQQEQLQ